MYIKIKKGRKEVKRKGGRRVENLYIREKGVKGKEGKKRNEKEKRSTEKGRGKKSKVRKREEGEGE